MEKLKTIGLSFKNTKEDRKLYEWIYSHSNVSGFIKDVLRREMAGIKVIKESQFEDNNDDNLIDLGDF